MPGYRLTFKYEEGANLVDVELVGNPQALRLGIGIAARMLGGKFSERLMRPDAPPGLMDAVAALYAIQQGGPVTAHEGEYLKIAPAPQAAGLSTIMNVTWSD